MSYIKVIPFSFFMFMIRSTHEKKEGRARQTIGQLLV